MGDKRENDPKDIFKENWGLLGSDLGDAGREIADAVKRILSVKELKDLQDNVHRTVRDATRSMSLDGKPGSDGGDKDNGVIDHASGEYNARNGDGSIGVEALRRMGLLSPDSQRITTGKNAASGHGTAEIVRHAGSYSLRKNSSSKLTPYINRKKYGYPKCVGMITLNAIGFVGSGAVWSALEWMANTTAWMTWMGHSQWLKDGIGSIGSALDVGAGIFGILTLLCGIGGLKWMSRMRMASLLRQFGEAVGDKNYIELSVLASKTGRSLSKVRKSIRKMLRKGALLDCYLDDDEHNLLIGPEAYEMYMNIKARQQNAAAHSGEDEAPTEQSTETQDGKTGAVADMEINSVQFIAHIRAINDALPEQDISDKLDTLEHISVKIFHYVEQHPDKLPQIRKFMDYYLPTTLKLMEAYRELCGHGSYGEVEETKAEIKLAMDKINHAFENLFGNLLRNDLMHLSADISALEAMLAQEGLSEDGLAGQGRAEPQDQPL